MMVHGGSQLITADHDGSRLLAIACKYSPIRTVIEDTFEFSSSFSDDGDDSFGSFQSANADGHVGFDGDGQHKNVHGNWK
jgi:hypothetical protein